MKHKRLNRDSWGFQFYPYYQIRIDCEFFHGVVCLIRLTDGEPQYWETPKAGRIQVTGGGMTWLELLPDHTNRLITVKYFPENKKDPKRKIYPKVYDQRYQPSIWYVDVIEGTEQDENGIEVYIDKYLDVIFTPEGDVKIDDRDELDEAYHSGELSQKQYDDALVEGDRILQEMCSDIPATEMWCSKIRDLVEKRIQQGEKPFFLYHGSQYSFDEVKPMKASGENEKESRMGIYAAESPSDVVPFALPIRWYPDDPSGKRDFECDHGKTKLIYGSLDPNGVGYIYQVKSTSFHKIDEWQWISEKPCIPTAILPVNVCDYIDTVEFSKEAEKINKLLYLN